MISYPAKIVWSKSDKCYIVEFPDLAGCLTYGNSIDTALENACEALTGYLESIDLRKISIPIPSKISGQNNIYYISPEKQAGFALWLKIKRAEKNLTQKEAAKMLSINFQSYQRFENPKKSNPTLKTILKIEEAFNEQIIVV